MAAREEGTEVLPLDEALTALGQSLRRMQEAQQRTEERMARMEERTLESLTRMEQRLARQEERAEERLARVEARTEAMGRLEERVVQLEASIKVATGKLLPRVEAVLQKLESNSPPLTTNASPTTSNLPPVATSSGAATTPTPPMTSEKRKALGEALFKAAAEGRARDVEKLLQDGADVDYHKADWYNRTALHVAAQIGHVDIMALLIATGAEVNRQSNDGWTPLHRAASNGQREVIEALIAAGARKDIRNNNGKTPYDVAAPSVRDLLQP